MALSNFAEGEGVMAPLPRPRWIACHHGAVLRRAGRADELGVAPGLGQRLGIVAANRWSACR